MKKEMRAYSNRRNKSLSSLIIDHFEELLMKENLPDVEQI